MDKSDQLNAGPYERWMFTHGVQYDLPSLELGTSPYRTHVAEVFWPTEMEEKQKNTLKVFLKNLQTDGFPDTIGDVADGSDYEVRISPLWTDSGQFLPTFIPFIGFVENNDGASGRKEFREIDLTQISNLKEKAEEHFSKIFKLKISLDLRMNFPVIQSTFNETDDPIKHRHVPKKPNTTRINKDDSVPVILAVIDDGIPFAHANFRKKGGSTRIEFCWSQGATATNHDGGAPNPNGGTTEKLQSESLQFGREFTASNIDKMVANFAGDEDAIYQECGLLSSADTGPKPLSRMHSHGAHVLDALAGNRPNWNENGVHVIAVDLPPSSTWDTSGFGKDMFILSAIHYIFLRADEISARYSKDGKPILLPLIINFSYGCSGGPHNGEATIERAMHEMIAARRNHAPTAIVMPSGNTFLERLHAVVMDQHFVPTKIENERVADVQWMLPPNDFTSSFLEVWLPPDLNSKDICLRLKAPNGACFSLPGTSISHKQGGAIVSSEDIKNEEQKTVGKLTLDRDRNSKTRFMIALAPTSQRPTGPESKILPTAQAGIWTLYFTLRGKMESIHYANRKKPTAGGLQCFIQRDTNLGQGNSGAQQSYFVDPEDDQYFNRGNLKQSDNVTGLKPGGDGGKSAKVRRFGSISGMATATSTLVVGGYNEVTKMAAPYSSAVALRYDTKGAQPLDKIIPVSAISERSPWQPGTVHAGTRSGVNGAVRGTSFAAPIVARQLGEIFRYSKKNKSEWSDANSDYSEFLNLDLNTNTVPGHPSSKGRLGDFLKL